MSDEEKSNDKPARLMNGIAFYGWKNLGTWRGRFP